MVCPLIKVEGVSTCFPQEDEASDSEEEVPEVATATEVKREEGGTLNLTLDEVRHIRTALTRAELEVSFLELGNESLDIDSPRVCHLPCLRADSASPV